MSVIFSDSSDNAGGTGDNPIFAAQFPPYRSSLLTRRSIFRWLKTALTTTVYVILISTFGIQSVRVVGRSMAPTIEDEDRLIVNKLVYCFRDARREDIVMFYFPPDPQHTFVKRIIAQEGDTVSIVKGRVYVNGLVLDDQYVPGEFRSYEDWGPAVIPEGYDFVMGDHRNNSSDSRLWGMVPKKYIIGRVELRWWPLLAARVF